MEIQEMDESAKDLHNFFVSAWIFDLTFPFRS